MYNTSRGIWSILLNSFELSLIWIVFLVQAAKAHMIYYEWNALNMLYVHVRRDTYAVRAAQLLNQTIVQIAYRS